MFVNNQHGIQRQGQDFDLKKHINTVSIRTYTHRGIKIGAQKKSENATCVHFSISAEYFRKFEFLISQGSAVTCLR